ncbi:glycerophosphodiester phosphodiesterase [Elusimicrobiota bacterium]
MKYNPLIIAHRGAMSCAPENSLSAIKLALKYPVSGIEFDLQLTQDNIPVLYHDRTLHKITARKKRVSDYTYNELLKMDWGTWYSKKYRGEKILAFKNILSKYASITRLLIEIKSRKIDSTTGRSKILTSEVLKLLKTHVKQKYAANIYILSFDTRVIEFALKKAPQWKYVQNIKEPPANNRYFNSFSKDLYGFCFPIKNLSTDLVRILRNKRKKVMTYSCNSDRQLKKALNMNIDYVMTDRPDWIFNNKPVLQQAQTLRK